MKAMKSFYKPAIALMLVMFTTNLIAQTDDDANEDMQDRKELVSDAQKAKTKFIANKGNIAELFTNAKGYVIFPNVGKGAYVVGGAAGNGVVYENGEVIGLAKLRQVDVGLQIGGQAFRQVIFFQTKSELERFKKGNFELSGNASAVVLEEGKAKSIEFRDGIAVVTMPKAGAMIEISVGGQKFEYEDWE
ncbi:lipid-binding SYLF domain-containing protein [Gillisia sp. M10.2A]|uniref:Lipid-binding SYLF domain-containing protein n=1 Tax=Gillisia lutea TaxID=2909668 RepID=A0ABS9ED33_9FLAO|nr:lipid-binding SYLF domain-containing protein [Gillisia lutea]MCF4100791.1 lipid-binding SYLF domain-containing protein [Gillisia lutea]